MSLIEGRDKALIDEWETEMLLKPLRVGHIQLYSTGLSESERDHVFVRWSLRWKRLWPPACGLMGYGDRRGPRRALCHPALRRLM